MQPEQMHILFVGRNCVINLSAHKSAFASITVECAQIALAHTHAPHKEGLKYLADLLVVAAHLLGERPSADGLIADNPFSELIRTKSADCCQFRMKNVVYMLFFFVTLFFCPCFCFSGILFCVFSIKLRKSLRDWWAHASDFVIVQIQNPRESASECLFWSPWQRINTKSRAALLASDGRAIYWPSKSSGRRPWLRHKINACGAHRTDKSDMGAIDRRQAARIHRHTAHTHTFMPLLLLLCVCVPLELALLK
jgi:hypothetical protein